MRTCPNCGHMLSEKDTICFKCGMQLSQISQPAPGNMPPQMNNNFNPMNNKGYNMQRPMNNNNDKSKMIYLVLGCVVVLAVIAVVIVLVTKNNKMDDDDNVPEEKVVLKPTEEEPEKPVEPEQPEEPEQPTPIEPEKPDQPTQPEQPQGGNQNRTPNGTEPQLKENQHAVANNGYKYAVPNEYSEKDYGVRGVHLINYKKTKQMIININIGTLANLKNNLPSVRQMYVDAGAVVHEVKIQVIADIEVLCVELTKNGQNMIIGIADAASGEIFAVNVYNSSTNDYDYSLLEEGIEIVKSAVKTGSTVAA